MILLDLMKQEISSFLEAPSPPPQKEMGVFFKGGMRGMKQEKAEKKNKYINDSWELWDNNNNNNNSHSGGDDRN